VSFFGSRVAVVPRASLLCRPRPALKKNSVFANGPATRPSLGDTCVSLELPPLAGSVRASTLLRTWSRTPPRARSTGELPARSGAYRPAIVSRTSSSRVVATMLPATVSYRPTRDAVVPQRRPTSLRASRPARSWLMCLAGVQAEHGAAVALLELVAAGARRAGPLQRIREVGVQVQRVADRIGRHLAAAEGAIAEPLRRQAGPRGVAAGGGIERVEATEGPAVEAAGVDQALRHLVGGGPFGAVAQQAGAPALRWPCRRTA
jgi:hypothetical protein